MSTPASTVAPSRSHLWRRPAALLLAAFVGLGILGGAGGAALAGLGADSEPGLHLDHHDLPDGVPGQR